MSSIRAASEDDNYDLQIIVQLLNSSYWNDTWMDWLRSHFIKFISKKYNVRSSIQSNIMNFAVSLYVMCEILSLYTARIFTLLNITTVLELMIVLLLNSSYIRLLLMASISTYALTKFCSIFLPVWTSNRRKLLFSLNFSCIKATLPTFRLC